MMASDTGASAWSMPTDGAFFGTFAYGSGPRGQEEFRSQNWLMLMPHRQVGRGMLMISTMLSLEPATVGAAGYSELFQVGESYRGLPVVDRQHPHDAFMQVQVAWQQQIGKSTVALSGGPSGSPALGPMPFMHRASAALNPVAPLSHHTFDSTHIAMGSMTAAVQRSWLTLEVSAFHGREPDEKRWDFDLGRFDSGSARLTVRPHREWSLQVSRGYLHQPEQLEPGNQKRTHGSASWLRMHPDGGYSAITLAAGRVSRTYSWNMAYLAEATHWIGKTAVQGRYEALGVETEHLLFPQSIHVPHPGELVDPLKALTVGAVRRVWEKGGVDVALGGNFTTYTPPPLLRETHGNRPMSVHAFFVVKPTRRRAPMPMALPMQMSMPSGSSHDGMETPTGHEHH